MRSAPDPSPQVCAHDVIVIPSRDKDEEDAACLVRVFYPCAPPPPRSTLVTSRTPWLPSTAAMLGYIHYLIDLNRLDSFRRICVELMAALISYIFAPILIGSLHDVLRGRAIRNPKPNPRWKADVDANDTTRTALGVIVFSHGFAGNRSTYSGLCVRLAKAGYVVAAIEHRDGTASSAAPVAGPRADAVMVRVARNRRHRRRRLDHDDDDLRDCVLRRFVQSNRTHQLYSYAFHECSRTFRYSQMLRRRHEARVALDLLDALGTGKFTMENASARDERILRAFEGVLDTNEAAIVGHSFGAVTAAMAWERDERFAERGLVLLDPWLQMMQGKRLERALPACLVVNSDHWNPIWRSPPPPGENNVVMQELLGKRAEIVSLAGTKHSSASDIPLAMERMTGFVQSFMRRMRLRENVLTSKSPTAKGCDDGPMPHLDCIDCTAELVLSFLGGDGTVPALTESIEKRYSPYIVHEG